MRRVLVATVVALAAFAAMPVGAGELCEKASEIRAAFEPRLKYEYRRAVRATGAQEGWPAEIRADFAGIRTEGRECGDIYDSYASYLEAVIAENDRMAERSDKTRGVIFRKW